MKKTILSILIITSLFISGCNSSKNGELSSDIINNKPYPQHTLYYSETISPNIYSQKEKDQHVSLYYEDWKEKYVVNEDGIYRVAFGDKGSKDFDITVSEGQGYGMIISVIMSGYDPESKKIYDGMLKFVKNNPSKFKNGLMNWKVDKNNYQENDSAFDGDADIAYSLILAHKQWGSQGNINYLEEAKEMIDNIYTYTIGKDSYLPMLGDWVDPFGSKYNQYTNRSSDLMLENFYQFSIIDSKWGNVLNKSKISINELQDNNSLTAMLLPDFFKSDTYEPEEKNFLEGENDGYYSYNAVRYPLRTGIYTLLQKDNNLRERLSNLSEWIENKSDSNLDKVYSGYDLQGNVLKGSNYNSSIFISTFGIAAMHNKDQQDWLNRIYENVKDRHEGYFEDTVTLLSLLVMSNNYWE